jgi:DNA processing protein
MPGDARNGACRECLRRAWLLSGLSALLDYHAHDETKLLDLLALDDASLIEAIGGRRRRALLTDWEAFTAGEHPGVGEHREPPLFARPSPPTTERGARPRAHPSGSAAIDVDVVCIHATGGPIWRRNGMPSMLHIAGGSHRMTALSEQPTIAIVGTARPTDYGMEMARDLARGLGASGLTIVSGLANGIAAAAHAGALEARAPTVTVMAGGVDVIVPAGRRGLYEQASARGCAMAELPCGHPVRRWCEVARARSIAALADLTIVVEAGEDTSELRVARAAQALGRRVAAVPGRVTSPASIGANALLMAGARLVRGPADALDLLYGLGDRRADPSPAQPGASAGAKPLQPRLRAVLEQVGAGMDTPGKLASAGANPDQAMQALSELELMGLLGRGDGGRYVPRESLTGR